MSDLVVALQSRRPSARGEAPDRLRTLLELLNRPDRAVPAIWVGGEHGKSSVIAMVAALFAALDVTAGAATAPHLQDMRERLRIAGEVVTAVTLRDTLRYLEPFLREVDTRYPQPLTFDEVLHALAATWFADAPVDVAVFEGVTDQTGRTWIIWDLICLAWLLEADWVPSRLVMAPTLDAELRWQHPADQHAIREAIGIDRDAIFRDFFRKLESAP